MTWFVGLSPVVELFFFLPCGSKLAQTFCWFSSLVKRRKYTECGWSRWILRFIIWIFVVESRRQVIIFYSGTHGSLGSGRIDARFLVTQYGGVEFWKCMRCSKQKFRRPSYGNQSRKANDRNMRMKWSLKGRCLSGILACFWILVVVRILMLM